MRKVRLTLAVVAAFGGLSAFAAPAYACGNEVGDPGCTVGGAANATLCVAGEVGGSVKGQPIDKGELADCFNQTN
jgi:hypothetical protein